MQAYQNPERSSECLYLTSQDQNNNTGRISERLIRRPSYGNVAKRQRPTGLKISWKARLRELRLMLIHTKQSIRETVAPLLVIALQPHGGKEENDECALSCTKTAAMKLSCYVAMDRWLKRRPLRMSRKRADRKSCIDGSLRQKEERLFWPRRRLQKEYSEYETLAEEAETQLPDLERARASYREEKGAWCFEPAV